MLGLTAMPSPSFAMQSCPPGFAPVGDPFVGCTATGEVIDQGEDSGEAAAQDIYGAIAWHVDAGDVWMSGNWTGGGAARIEALGACNKAMGGGCMLMGVWRNSSYSIFRDNGGVLWSAWNGRGGAERKRIFAECSAKQLLPCEELGSFSASKKGYQPKMPAARKRYAVAAWVAGADGYDNRLYIASGHPTYAAAETAALQACARATGRSCKRGSFAGNGFIQPFLTGAGIDGQNATPETSAKRAQQAARIDCQRQKKSCALQKAYDSRVSGLFVHDFTAASR